MQNRTEHMIKMEAARRDSLKSLHPLLSRIDTDALAKLEAFYQQEVQNQLFLTPLDNKDEIIGDVARMKGARAFVEFVGRSKIKAEQIVGEDEREL